MNTFVGVDFGDHSLERFYFHSDIRVTILFQNKVMGFRKGNDTVSSIESMEVVVGNQWRKVLLPN